MDYLNYTERLFNIYNKKFSYINLNNKIDYVSEKIIEKLHPESVENFFPIVKQILNADFNEVENINDTSIIHEYEFTIKMLTLFNASNIFFRKLDNEIKITNSIHKKYKKYKYVANEINHTEINLILNKNECKIIIKHNLVELKFTNIWQNENINKIINLFNIYDIIATTKTDIKFYYVNDVKIMTNELYIIQDIFFTNDLYAKYIHINEINFNKSEKFKHRIFIYNIKFYLIEQITNYLNFYNKIPLKFSTDVLFFKNVLDHLMYDFERKKDDIIKHYKNIIKNKEIKKLKTKHELFKLVEIEPSIFGKSTRYSQQCQKKRQPSIVKDRKAFVVSLTETLKKFYKDNENYPYEEDNLIIKKFLKSKNIKYLDDLIHIENINGTDRMFVCLRDNLTKLFPGYISDTNIICCFDKKCIKNAQKLLSHILKEDKVLEDKRIGYLPHLLSDIIGNEYKRFGYKNLYSVLYELYKLDTSLIISKHGKEILNFDIELNDLILSRKTKGHTIAYKSKEIEFYLSNEKIVEYLKKRKSNILNIYAEEFKNDYNILSFIFKINIINYKHITKYDVPMFSINQITSISYPKYLFIYKNSNDIYEVIIDKDKQIIHTKGPLINYIKYYFKEYDDINLI